MEMHEKNPSSLTVGSIVFHDETTSTVFAYKRAHNIIEPLISDPSEKAAIPRVSRVVDPERRDATFNGRR